MSEREPSTEAIARALQDLRVSEARATELAIEIERLNGAVRAAARSLAFADEPAGHAAVLERCAE